MSPPGFMIILSFVIIAALYGFFNMVIQGSLQAGSSILIPLFNFTLMWYSILLVYQKEENRNAYKCIFYAVVANTSFWITCALIGAIKPGVIPYVIPGDWVFSIGYSSIILLIGFGTASHPYRSWKSDKLPQYRPRKIGEPYKKRD